LSFHNRALNLQDFHYDLPQERIATHPLQERDASKLLVWNKGRITHSAFKDLTDYLPDDSHLFFNNTKVIPARLIFHKDTGAVIEVFLLHPLTPHAAVHLAMQARSDVSWECTIGNKKRWSQQSSLVKTIASGTITAALTDSEKNIVTFSWSGDSSFAEVLLEAGETPLPPYLHRPPETSDRENYQTIYSRHEGAVAAPTAGLHFTERVFEAMRAKNILHDYLTLHVSAGTFQPIKHDDPLQHVMHNEQVVVTRENIEHAMDRQKKIIAVGTTSMRTLESLYWYGVKILNGEEDFIISQHDPWNLPSDVHPNEALTAILEFMDRKKSDQIIGETAIYIRPGYTFRVCEGLITNFHQPASTLILLVAAFTGMQWRTIYDEALRNDYRFLSYGDSSLLLP
jgi:S-adenosylmethionine:tRNA ribosyltransferase-isomerase